MRCIQLHISIFMHLHIAMNKIIILSVLILLIGAVVAFFFYRKKKEQNSENQSKKNDKQNNDKKDDLLSQFWLDEEEENTKKKKDYSGLLIVGILLGIAFWFIFFSTHRYVSLVQKLPEQRKDRPGLTQQWWLSNDKTYYTWVSNKLLSYNIVKPEKVPIDSVSITDEDSVSESILKFRTYIDDSLTYPQAYHELEPFINTFIKDFNVKKRRTNACTKRKITICIPSKRHFLYSRRMIWYTKTACISRSNKANNWYKILLTP